MLVNDVIHGSESLGTVVIVIDLEQVYEEYLAPLNIENTGDIIVKNEKGTIIMHPNAKLLTFIRSGRSRSWTLCLSTRV